MSRRSIVVCRGSWMLNSQQRVAIFVPSMHDGGAERTMLNLSQGVAARGYLVDLVLARTEGPHLKHVPDSVRVVDLKASRVLASLPALARYLRVARPLAMLSVMKHANIVALWARRLSAASTRVVVSERNTLSVSARHAQNRRARLMPRLIKRFYPWADQIVTVSHGVADDLAQVMGVPRERIHVIYNPVVTSELRRKAQAPLEHPWFAPGQPPIVLGVGRLQAQKDFPTLIQAFAQVHRARRARLLILGEGAERPALETLVRRLGLEHDVGLPVFIEALYCGVPVIATDCPSGPLEILSGGRYGQLVPVGDVSAMARAIERGLDNQIPRPPCESWRPFEHEAVVSQYIDLLLGDRSCAKYRSGYH